MSETFSGRVAVLGLGYIGLPTAVALATRGVEVIGVDVNEETVAAVARGEVPFVEPDLALGVSGAVAIGRLTATTETPEAAAFIIAVPTPFLPDRTADLSYIRAATEQIAPTAGRGDRRPRVDLTARNDGDAEPVAGRAPPGPQPAAH